MNLKNHARHLAIGMLASMLLVAAGCSRGKDEATRAVSAAEASLATIREDAAKYMPGELQSVESSLASAKDNLAKGEYQQVTASLPALSSSIDSLKSGVAAKAEEAKAAAAEWTTYVASVPQMVTALQSRVDILAKSKRYPKGLDAASFTTLQSDFANMKSDWAAAMSASTADNPVEAVAKAKSAQSTGQRLLQQLGMSAPAAG
jgi:hypothetical protein